MKKLAIANDLFTLHFSIFLVQLVENRSGSPVVINDDIVYSRFINYTPETGFLYSSRIITDSVQETRFLCTTFTWNIL